MVDKVNGSFIPGEKTGRDLDFFVFSGPVNILVKGDSQGNGNTANTGTSATQTKLDKLVEVIALRGQPVLSAKPTTDGTTYTLKFATEHTGAWTATDLKAAVIAHHADFMAANASLINVTISPTLS